MKALLPIVLILVASACIGGQTPAGQQEIPRSEAPAKERERLLKSGHVTPVSMGEAELYFGSESGYELAKSPKVTPDGATYHIDGRIEFVDKTNEFVAKFKWPTSTNPYEQQVLRELQKLTGMTEEPYFSVQVPGPLVPIYKSKARLNGRVALIGRYTRNLEISMTDKSVRMIPEFQVIGIEFNSDKVPHFMPGSIKRN